jgi:hypothetical protein
MSGTQQQDKAWEIGAGTGLGLLMGVLLGLSVTGVIGGVISGLAAMLAAFFGLVKSSAAAGQSAAHAWRIASFGFACTIGVILGVEARAHNWMGASVQAQVEQWRAAGASSEDAVAFVAYQQLGIVPTGRTVGPRPLASSATTALFASHDQAECSTLSKTRFASAQNRLAAMRGTGGSWAKFATAAADVPADKLDEWLDAGYQLVCGD